MRKPKRRFTAFVENLDRRANPSTVSPLFNMPIAYVEAHPPATPAVQSLPYSETQQAPTPLKPQPIPQDPSLPPLKPDNPPLEPHLPAYNEPVQYPDPAMTHWVPDDPPSIYQEGYAPPSGPSAFDPGYWEHQPTTSDPIDIYKPYDPADGLLKPPPAQSAPVYTPAPDGLQSLPNGGTPRDVIDPINGVPAPPDNGIQVTALASASPVAGVPYVVPVAYVESAPPRAYNPANDPAWGVPPAVPRTTGPYDPNDPLQAGAVAPPPVVNYGPTFDVKNIYGPSIKPLPVVPTMPPPVYPF